ncbi:MAG: hypothetical protein HWN67_10390 [Candidatus Helarchaeota archaeon]|nr:hypothetical protein [Candidatus Helarchaeota archaeon]
MSLDENTKGFMKEIIEFISLIRASEKERYELQKKFMEDTIKTIKDISESIKASSEYLRTSIEKLKETLSTGIDNIRKEISVDSIIEAKNALGETVDILQRETQLFEFKQTIHEIRSSLDNIQRKNLQQQTKNPQITANKKNIIEPEVIQKESPTEMVSELEEKKVVKKKKQVKKDEKFHIEF